MAGSRALTLALVLCLAAASFAAPVVEPTTAGSAEDVVLDDPNHFCLDHGEITPEGTCVCERGFTGAHCENVIVSGKVMTDKKAPVTACNIKVYGSSDITKKENLLGETQCNADGSYSIVVPHHHTYVVSGVNAQGTEGIQYYTVPQSKLARTTSNRARRSHDSDWRNAYLLIPGWMLAEQWYAHIFWGFDHTSATCDLNMMIHGPWNGGCTSDVLNNRYSCRLNNSYPVTNHYMAPMTPDSNCVANYTTWGYEAYTFYEIGQNQPFEIFAWGADYLNINYQRFRYNYVANGVFAYAALYRAGDDGAATLVGNLDLKASSQTMLSPGPYWHLWSVVVNTPPDNINDELPGAGVVTARNTVSCSPLAMVGSDAIQSWENPMTTYPRGLNCPRRIL